MVHKKTQLFIVADRETHFVMSHTSDCDKMQTTKELSVVRKTKKELDHTLLEIICMNHRLNNNIIKS